MSHQVTSADLALSRNWWFGWGRWWETIVLFWLHKPGWLRSPQASGSAECRRGRLRKWDLGQGLLDHFLSNQLQQSSQYKGLTNWRELVGSFQRLRSQCNQTLVHLKLSILKEANTPWNRPHQSITVVSEAHETRPAARLSLPGNKDPSAGCCGAE